ncbi:YceD family protein [Ovoidimarina sediminis]|uniref:YceD family protein n=1 Tax=Ovoidimarina sediminis TaxID=3079856 RepID=UPI0029084911|nr:YceD family protein [Rhodophyticola sp. MJ-SS7]MDU8946084.1 YceD family protein [Rhodophyticola sp. MJ-SS7]
MERNEETNGVHLLPLGRMPGRDPVAFSLMPDKAERAKLAERLDLLGLPKLRFEGEVAPEGRGDWRLSARLGATVVQPCGVTLEPVTTRLDEDVSRLYLRDLPDPGPGEVEMPEDDSVEALPGTLDLGEVMAEALALALPAFPRAPGVAPGDAQFTEPGKTPMRDEDTKPFAGLGALKAKLEKKDGED